MRSDAANQFPTGGCRNITGGVKVICQVAGERRSEEG
jgi:hypothetical protein